MGRLWKSLDNRSNEELRTLGYVAADTQSVRDLMNFYNKLEARNGYLVDRAINEANPRKSRYYFPLIGGATLPGAGNAPEATDLWMKGALAEDAFGTRQREAAQSIYKTEQAERAVGQ